MMGIHKCFNVCFMCDYYKCVLLAVTIWIFIWFMGIVPTCEKSFGIIGVIDRGSVSTSGYSWIVGMCLSCVFKYMGCILWYFLYDL